MSDSKPKTRTRTSVFRPCIDLHDGKVKQIVGATLTDGGVGLATNFIASDTPGQFATKYKQDGLTGGHVIKLGKGNDEAALDAVRSWPNGLHIGGGINDTNAKQWIDNGAEKVIVTSWFFDADGKLLIDRCNTIKQLVGKDRLVIDLSCRKQKDKDGWFVTINKWQTTTDVEVNKQTLVKLSEYASEFLIHAADVEGLCQGIDQDLVKCLGEWSPIPCTYAGGARSIDDLALVDRLSNGWVDLTFGSALDIFGGKGVTYAECVAWNKKATNSCN